jgi:hypothetical protein
MNESNKKKDELLGEPHGTANAKLRKAILFQLLQETGKDICFQCGKKIEEIESLSIEHKKSWMAAKDPIKSFYDLNNIAFSHLKCNINASNKKVPHLNGRGENHPNNKLTLIEVDEIKEKLGLGYSIKKLREEYGITNWCIYSIKDGKRWNY